MADVFDKKLDDEKGNTTSDLHRRAVEHVRAFMSKSQEYRRPHLELATRCRELYASWIKSGRSIIGRANLNLAYAFSIIEGEIPQIVEALLGERPLAKFEGNEIQDMVFEDALNDFHDIQVEKMNLLTKTISYVKSMLLDGTTFGKVPYRYEEKAISKKRITINPVTNEIEKSTDEELKVLYDGPDFQFIPFIDFFPDWTARIPGEIQSMRGCVHRTWRTLSDIKKISAYKNVAELEHSVLLKGCSEGTAWKEPYYSGEYQAEQDRLHDNTTGIKTEGLIELWEYWGTFTVDGESQDYIITIANGDVVLRCEENFYEHKFKPFVATPNTIRDGEFYGIPELLPIEAYIKEANTLRNSRLDQVNLAINRMYLADRTAGIKAKQLFVRPSGIIWTNDMNGLKELPPPEVPPSATRELQELQVEMKDTLGVVNGTPQLSQAAKTFGRSATGVQFVNSISASRVGLKVRVLNDTFIKPVHELMFKINDQFVTDEQWVRVSDPDKAAENPFTHLPPDAFEKDFKIKTVVDNGSKENQLQNLQQVGQLLQTAEGTQPGITKWDVFFEAVGRNLMGPRYKKFIRSDQERQMMQMQQLAQQQAAQAQTGLSAPQPNALPKGTPQ